MDYHVHEDSVDVNLLGKLIDFLLKQDVSHILLTNLYHETF
jgi:hypothetical protein